MSTDREAGNLDDPGPAGGRARRLRAQGPKSESLRRVASTYDHEFPRYVDEFIFGEIWGRPGMSQDERMLVAISALAATEHPDQLSNYIWGALYSGMPASKIHEVFMMMPIYAGFPVTLASLRLWKEIRQKARAQGMSLDMDEPADS